MCKSDNPSTITDEVAAKIQSEIDSDIVLECRIKSDGRTSWRIPNDLIRASYMLKILDSFIARLIMMSLQPKPSNIIKPVIKPVFKQ